MLPLTGGWERVLVAGGAHLEEATRAAVPELRRENLLLEPMPRNTAPCIGWAVATLARSDPEALVMVQQSDHHVADDDAFSRTVEVALASAARGVLTTIGIRPHAPETGYGSIEVDGAPRAGEATRVARFVEKPDRARAEQFLASGRFLWNAGMFFFRAKDLLAAIRVHVPELAAVLEDLDRAALRGDEASVLAAAFARAPSVSLDVGVLEKHGEIAVVPGDFGWSDVGSWQSAWELAQKDEAGNATSPSSVLVDARGNLVVDRRTTPGEKTIALVGVEGLAVVVTDDAVLVLPRDRAQDVRAAVDLLKKSSPKLVVMEPLHALVVGEALWDLRAPRGTAFVDAPSLALDAGGGAVRAALALKAAGADVELAAVFGDDPLGAALRERVARAGIGVAASVSSKAARTGLVAMDIDREGARRVVAYRSKDEPAPPWPACGTPRGRSISCSRRASRRSGSSAHRLRRRARRARSSSSISTRAAPCFAAARRRTRASGSSRTRTS